MEPASFIIPLLEWHSTAKKVIALRFNRICVFKTACFGGHSTGKEGAYGTHAGMFDVAVGMSLCSSFGTS